MKKQEAFDNVITSQDERLGTLHQHSNKLLAQNHFDCDNIKQRVGEVTIKRQKVKQLSTARKQRLSDQLLHAQFIRDVSEVSMQIWCN